MILTWLEYISDVAVLATYALLVRRNKPLPFHWANALGGLPLIIAEVHARLWQVLVLTGTFTVLGWVGLYTHYIKERR